MKKFLSCLLVLTLLGGVLTGCGKKSGGEDAGDGAASGEDMARAGEEGLLPGEVRDAYVVENITLPQQVVFYEAMADDTLFYLNYIEGGIGGADAVEPAVLSADLSEGESEPEPVTWPLPQEEEPVSGSLIVPDRAGGVYLISSRYEGTEAASYIADIILSHIGSDGKSGTSRSIIDIFGDNPSPYVSGGAVDAEGILCLAVGNTLHMLTKEGEPAGEITCGGPIVSLCSDDAGKLYGIWNQSGVRMLSEINTKELIMEGNREVPELGGLIGAGPGTAGKLVFATQSGVYDYNPADKSLTERFQWFSLDLAVEDMYDKAYPLSDGRILLVERAGDQWSSAATSLKVIRPRREGEIVAERPVPAAEQEQVPLQGEAGDIVLGVTNLDAALKDAVVAFNQTNPDGRIELKEYGAGGRVELEAGIQQLNADIASGNCPDILILSPGEYSMDLYGAAGALMDLNPYFDRDESLERSKYQENIIRAYESDGKLYMLPITFMIEGIMGKTASLGDRTGWNLDEMIAYADEVGQDDLLFVSNSKSAVMELCMKANADNIVDWSSEQGSGFQRDFFLKMLKFANRFLPDEQSTEEMFQQRYGNEDIMLVPGMITPLSKQFSSIKEPVTYIGFPSEKGSGTLVTTYSAVAVSSNCKAMGTAWKFIAGLLKEEVQDSPLLEGYPILKSSLARQMEAMKEYSGSVVSSGTDGKVLESFELTGVTDEELRIFQDLIDSVEKAVSWDDQISQIIAEEAGAYFSGSKTAEEVTDIVENRIGIYVSESK